MNKTSFLHLFESPCMLVFIVVGRSADQFVVGGWLQPGHRVLSPREAGAQLHSLLAHRPVQLRLRKRRRLLHFLRGEKKHFLHYSLYVKKKFWKKLYEIR